MSGTDFYYPLLSDVAKKLAEIAPGDSPKRVYFGNSGAEAIEAAIKIALHHTRRSRLIAFFNCFHGRTMGALSLTSSKPAQRRHFGALLAGVAHAPYANPYRCPCGAKSGEGEYACACADYIENVLFKTTTPPEDVAAIFVEPVQGEGGYIVPPKRFLQRLREIADQHGILLVFDEVQCGMGRTGKMWAAEHFGVVPDILCSAKGIASGMPLGVAIARADLMDWGPGAHASTFGGNPVACAAALETIRLLQEKYIANSAAMGEYFRQKMAEWPRKHRIVGDVRGLGLMNGIEFVKDQSTKEPHPEARNRVVERAFQQGLLTLGCGESTLRMMPPLIVEKQHVDFALDVLDRSISEVEKATA